MLFYPVALPLSTSTLNRVAGLIRTHRKTIGSRWRVLDPGTQALATGHLGRPRVLFRAAQGRDGRLRHGHLGLGRGTAACLP